MISGKVKLDGTPQVVLSVGGRDYAAVVDTGFNGDFELPEALREPLSPEPIGKIVSNLAAGLSVEDYYRVLVPFDGELVEAEVTFVRGDVRQR